MTSSLRDTITNALYEEPGKYCERCKGIGQDENAHFWCSDCDGKGWVVDEEVVSEAREQAEELAVVVERAVRDYITALEDDRVDGAVEQAMHDPSRMDNASEREYQDWRDFLRPILRAADDVIWNATHQRLTSEQSD